MNGLEAIEFMKQGKMVISRYSDDVFVITKIVDGKVYYVFEHLKSDDDDDVWHIDDCFDFTNTYEEYNEPKQLTGWERSKVGEKYHFIKAYGMVTKDEERYFDIDDQYYNTANYFSTKEKAEEINFKQALFRRLQRFSDENGGDDIDWNNTDNPKYYISFNYSTNKFYIDFLYKIAVFGSVYFVSEEVTQQAIELFHDDLIEYFTMYE